MKVVSLLCLFFLLALVVVGQKDLVTQDGSSGAELKLKEISKQSEVCRNLCFAFSGSASLSNREFEEQKNFMFDLLAVHTVDRTFHLSAVQYGVSIQPITPLVVLDPLGADDLYGLLSSVESLRENGSFLSGGINYCADQFHTRKNESSTIILFSNGDAEIDEGPVLAANRYRDGGGDLILVAVGRVNFRALLDIAGGDLSKISHTQSFLEILRVDDMISGC